MKHPRLQRRTFLRDDGITEVEIGFYFYPGEAEHRSMNPELYDPGSAPEVDIFGNYMLSKREIARFEQEVIEDWEPDEPDWDALRDQRRDEALERAA